jgi:hypothetical protein
MLRGLTSLQIFVDDVTAAERWYSDLLGIKPYFRSEDAGLPPGHVGFRVGDSQSELGVTDRKLAPAGLGTGPAGTVTYWQVDDVPRPSIGCSPWVPSRSSLPQNSAGDSGSLRWRTRSGTHSA